MKRITKKILEARVEWLNEIAGQPKKPYRRDSKGRLTANIGNYHISYACGGVSLHQMQNEGGRTRDVFNCGHISKGDLFNRICAFMDCIGASK